MKLLITCERSDNHEYQHFYDIEKKCFLENNLLQIESKPPIPYTGSLPYDLANKICLQAFIFAIKYMDFDSAFRLLMISKSTHVTIAKYFSVKSMNMFGIVKLASTMIDIGLEEKLGKECIHGMIFNTHSLDPVVEHLTIMTFQGTTINSYQTGPSLLDNVLVGGVFGSGICVCSFFAMPYIIFKVENLFGVNVLTQNCITNRWIAASEILKLCIGENFKLLCLVAGSGRDLLIEVTTTPNQTNNPIGFTFT